MYTAGSRLQPLNHLPGVGILAGVRSTAGTLAKRGERRGGLPGRLIRHITPPLSLYMCDSLVPFS